MTLPNISNSQNGGLGLYIGSLIPNTIIVFIFWVIKSKNEKKKLTNQKTLDKPVQLNNIKVNGINIDKFKVLIEKLENLHIDYYSPNFTSMPQEIKYPIQSKRINNTQHQVEILFRVPYSYYHYDDTFNLKIENDKIKIYYIRICKVVFEAMKSNNMPDKIEEQFQFNTYENQEDIYKKLLTSINQIFENQYKFTFSQFDVN